MAENIYTVKITNSPSNSNLEVAGELVLKLHSPYSDKSVTVKVNPNIVEYKDEPNANLRQFSKSVDTDDTKILEFDFQKNNVKNISIGGKGYEIKLLHIGKVSEQGKDFKTFEFMITER